MTDTKSALTPRVYQAICGLALAAMFLVQMQQNVALAINALMLIFGMSSIMGYGVIGPIAVLLLVGGGQISAQYLGEHLVAADLRGVRAFNLQTLLLSTGALTYVIGQYRLQGLWSGVLPGEKPRIGHARSPGTLSTAELAALVVPILFSAMLADLAWSYLRQPKNIASLPPRWSQFLLAAWIGALGVFFMAHVFRYWRRVRMDRATAQLLLQDVLWNETRGEQRSIQRWLAWRRKRRSSSANG